MSNLSELIVAVRSIQADLCGNADNRIRGDMIMIERRRIENLLKQLEKYDKEGV